MIVLGFSGFAGALPYKRAHCPDLDERELRICQGHDAAAALVADGELVAAAAEERFDRRKHSAAFPVAATRYCLAAAGLELDAVDEIVHAFDYGPFRAAYGLDGRSRQLYDEVLSPGAVRVGVRRHLGRRAASRTLHVPHHLAHAASAYFSSGWDECLVVVADGMGEVDGLTIYRAAGGQLERLAAVSALDSIGILYSVVTLHLGFDFNADEFKIMGLAPYGDPARFRAFFERAVELLPDGRLRIPILRLNREWLDRETYGATRRLLSGELLPARSPGAPIEDAHRDLAAALQESLERALLHVCGRFRERTGLSRLALAGGVALNCTANGKLTESGLFEELFVQPAAGDDGSALGAALLRTAEHGQVRNRRIPTPFLGPAATATQVEAALERFADRIAVERFSDLTAVCRAAARSIAGGRVVAWFRGRMEFGPRALGHRSILADPSRPEMRDRINALVKKRESFRPFAPAVTVREVDRWFAVVPGTELPYMIRTVAVRPEHRPGLPAVTHVDGSARVQTVSPEDNADFHALLTAVGERTGRELVLNTSFNVKGQPIVATAQEAIETLLATGIDELYLEAVRVRPRSPDAAITTSRRRSVRRSTAAERRGDAGRR